MKRFALPCLLAGLLAGCSSTDTGSATNLPVKVEHFPYQGPNGPWVYTSPAYKATPQELGIRIGTKITWQPVCSEETLEWAKLELSDSYIHYEKNKKKILENQTKIKKLKSKINDINRTQINAVIVQWLQENQKLDLECKNLANMFVKKRIQAIADQVPITPTSPYISKGKNNVDPAGGTKIEMSDELQTFARINQASLYRKYQTLQQRKKKIEVAQQSIASVCNVSISDSRLDALPIYQFSKIEYRGICLELREIVIQLEKLRTDDMIQNFQ